MKRLGALAVAMAILAIAPLASAHTNATVVQVKGGELFFKLSTRSIAMGASSVTSSVGPPT